MMRAALCVMNHQGIPKDWTTVSLKDMWKEWGISVTSRAVTVKHQHPLNAVWPRMDVVGIRSQPRWTIKDLIVKVCTIFLLWGTIFVLLGINSVLWTKWPFFLFCSSFMWNIVFSWPRCCDGDHYVLVWIKLLNVISAIEITNIGFYELLI